MNAANAPIEISDADLARECLYRFLAAVVGGPFAPGWDDIRDETDQDLVLGAVDALGEDGADWTALIEALRVAPGALRDEHDRVFGLIAPKECPPYETEYYPTAETFARS